MNKNKTVWGFENYDKLKIKSKSIKEIYKIEKIEDIATSLNYKKNEDLKYSINLSDSFSQNIFCMSYMFFQNHFV